MLKNFCIRPLADTKQIHRSKKKISERNGSFDYLSKGLELVGNDVRLKILYLLHEEKQLCVCDISDILGMSVSSVSQHLRKLRDGNAIEGKRKGQTVFYSIKAEQKKLLRPIFRFINSNKPKRGNL